MSPKQGVCERVLADCWAFSLDTQSWRLVEPAGSRPCARALMSALTTHAFRNSIALSVRRSRLFFPTLAEWCLFHAGVASHGHRTVIACGIANLNKGSEQLLCSDMFEFDSRKECWTQVRSLCLIVRVVLQAANHPRTMCRKQTAFCSMEHRCLSCSCGSWSIAEQEAGVHPW